MKIDDTDLKEALTQATPIDRLELLFGMLAKLISNCATLNDQRNHSIDPDLVVEVIDVIDFLREHLRADHPSAFNLAFRKFYLDLHRLMIDANRDGCSRKLDQACQAITKLLGPMLNHDFLRNCQDESLFERTRIDSVLMHLHELTCGPKLASTRVRNTHALVSLH